MSIRRIFSAFILWAIRRSWPPVRVVTFGDDFLFKRYQFLWLDEYELELTNGTVRMAHKRPWWAPFNAFLHWWNPTPGAREGMHDHPRWSITICLRGRMIERTPWRDRILKPGSIVFRSRKYIHEFHIPAEYRGKTWTLFIVGRRKYRQNTYQVTAQ